MGNEHKSRILSNTFYAHLIAFILSSLTQTVGSIVDGVIIGQCLGVQSTAAFGVISPLLTAYSIVGAAIASGARSRYTMYLGSGQTEKRRAYSRHL